MFRWVIRAVVAGAIIGIIWVTGSFVTHNLRTSSLFNIKVVEVRGARHTDAEKLRNLYAPMVGQNIFREITQEELMADDPWIQRLEIKRSFPSTLVVMVIEEKELIAYKSGKKCMALTESGANIERDCSGVHITVQQAPLPAEFRNFVEMYKANEVLRTSELILRNGFFTIKDGKTLFVSTYEPSVFADNYKTYIEKISPRYKSVEQVNITIPGKVYVKGVKNG